LNKIQAMRSLVSGKKIRGTAWCDKNQYLYIKDDIIVNQNNEPDYRFDTWDYSCFDHKDVWEEYEEKIDWNFEAGEIIKCDYNSLDYILYKIVYFCNDYIVTELVDKTYSKFPYIFYRYNIENKDFSIQKV